MTEQQKKAVFIANNEFRGIYAVAARKLEKDIDFGNLKGCVYISQHINRLKKDKIYNDVILDTCIEIIDIFSGIKFT